MKRYKKLNGDSGVSFYEEGRDFIKVRFNAGDMYLYTSKSVGSVAIKQMKLLAKKGKGLSTFISRFVKDKYELHWN